MNMESRLVVARRRGERGGWMGVWGWWIQTVTFGMHGQWAPTIQHRELYMIESLCYMTEIEETL